MFVQLISCSSCQKNKDVLLVSLSSPQKIRFLDGKNGQDPGKMYNNRQKLLARNTNISGNLKKLT